MIPKVLNSLNLDQLICFYHTHVRIVWLHMILFLHLKHVFHQHGPGMCFERKLQRTRTLRGATPILIFNNWPHQLWTECAEPGEPCQKSLNGSLSVFLITRGSFRKVYVQPSHKFRSTWAIPILVVPQGKMVRPRCLGISK